MSDNERLVNIDIGPSYVSPWGQPGRKSTIEKLMSELENYDLGNYEDSLIIRRDMVKNVALIPQIIHINMIIFGAAVYIQHSKKYISENISENIITSLIDRFNKLEKRKEIDDNNSGLTHEDLRLAIKANIIRYIYIIDKYLNSEHQIIDEDELDNYEQDLDIGVMDEFNDKVNPDLEYDPLEEDIIEL